MDNKLIDQYKKLELLGKGSTGEVYKVLWLSDQKYFV
jgi:hypothetical protein